MKAIVHTEYGPPDVLHVAEIETPTPKADEILIQVQATTVNFGDLVARNVKAMTRKTFNMPTPLLLPTRLAFGYNKPRKGILGSEFAGEVAAVGAAVTRFKVGDRVYGYTGMNMGAYAEYLCIKAAGSVALMPNPLTFAEAATLPYGAIMAHNLLKAGRIQAGHQVLINGASGGIGAMAVQLAKQYGAEVTGVCGTPRMDFVRALGADHVIDYRHEDFTQGAVMYDLVVDILGRQPFSKVKRVLQPQGRLLYISFKTHHLLQMLWTRFRGGQRVVCAISAESGDDLRVIAERVEAGTVKAIVDRCFPMEQAAAAHQYVESGAKHGPVVIQLVASTT